MSAIAEVADTLVRHSDLVQNGKKHIRHRSTVRRNQVQIAFYFSVCVTGKEDRHAYMVVNVGVAHGASVQDERMIEQVSIPVGSALELLKEVRHLGDMILI